MSRKEQNPEPPLDRPPGPPPPPPPVPASLLRKLRDLEQYEEAGRFRFLSEESSRDAAIRIGEWTISRTDDGKIWISDEAGEGGTFDEQKLAEAIEEFYMENF